MSISTYFRASSYAMIVMAMLALVFAGGLHAAPAALAAAAMVFAWKLEGTKWQLSERVGLLIVLLSIPLFFLDWHYQKALGEAPERMGVNALAHLIVFLSAVKLLQVKSDRDWVFLYLISFFEMLLAAGLSFSPLFLASLSLYLLCGLSTTIAFEIMKAKRSIVTAETRLLVPPDSAIFKRRAIARTSKSGETTRLPFVAGLLLLLIFLLALPLFLVAPRSGSASISRSGASLTNFIGFSETVTLGELGTLKRNNEIVMHVRVEQPQSFRARELRWRGVALDEFTGKSWKKSQEPRRTEQRKNDRGYFQLGTTQSVDHLTTQTFFLEPFESSILFAAPRVVALQGDFPAVYIDRESSLHSRRHDFERIIYKAFSDTTEPEADTLRMDFQPYVDPASRYTQLPRSIDPRIGDLARAMIANAHARNRYDTARAIENQLQTEYGYSLEMKAGGPDPLADFLFNVRAGHCEYFSTAMAVMLRTQGIQARVVNGFLPGEYNEAAGAYTVRQSDAHSWVEVYFPETNSWITFDPTPAAGRIEPVSTGLVAQVGKYAEALQLLWFQYVVGYDKQEQRSLATALNNRLFDLRRSLAKLNNLKKIVPVLTSIILPAVLTITVFWLLIRFVKRVRRFGWRRAFTIGRVDEPTISAVEFYDRLVALLAARGLKRTPDQTPLEFASALPVTEATILTQAYNRVRYGAEELSKAEAKQIESILTTMEREKSVLNK